MARKRLTSLPDGLWTKLADLEAHVRKLDLVRGCGWTLAVAAISVAAGVVIDICLELSVSLRIGLLVSAGVTTSLAFVLMIWRPWRRQRSVVDLAATVERANPELQESLVSCIELYDTSIPESERGSPLMRELAARQALHAAAAIDFCGAVSARPARRMLITSLLAWSLLLAPLAFPSSYRLLLARFFSPWQNLDRVASFWFDVDQGDRVVVRGSDVTIAARPRGDAQELPETVTLNWVDASGEVDSRRLDLDPESGLYTTTIPHVMQGFEYHLAGAGNRSRHYRIEVVDAPAVATFSLEIQPPAYTGQPAKVLDGPTGDIGVLERSQLQWKLTFNKPLRSAEIVWLKDTITQDPLKPGSPEHGDPGRKNAENLADAETESVELQLADDGLSARWQTMAEMSSRFWFVVRDEYDLKNESEPPRHLIVVADLAPVLKLSRPVSDVAQPSDTIPIPVQATDDIGLATLELHYEVDRLRKGIVQCPLAELGKTEVTHTFSMSLTDLYLKDNEVVSYRVRATDERPVPGPNETWSERFVIRIDSKAKPPGTTELAAEQQQLQDQLKQLRKETAENQTEIANLKQQAEAAEKDPQAVDRGQARQDQEALEKATDLLEKLQTRLEQLAAALQQHPLFANLTETARQLAEEEFAKAKTSLNQAEEAKAEKRAQPLSEAANQLAQADQKLAAMEGKFENLAKLERDLLELNRLAANADQLAERLRDLDERKQKPAPAGETPDEKKRREEIQQVEEKQLLTQQQELAKKADDLLKRQPELQQSALQNQLQQLAKLTQKVQDLAQPQRQIVENLQAAAKDSAEKNQDLIEQQQALQQQTEKLQSEIAAAKPQETPLPDPIDPAKLEQALAALKAGNFGAAAKAEAELAKQLEKLEQDLRKQGDLQAADSKPMNPQEFARTQAERAQNLADQQSKAAQAAQAAVQKDKQVTSEQAKLDQEQLKKRQEELQKLDAGKSQEAKDHAVETLQKAAEKQQAVTEQAKMSPATSGEPATKNPSGNSEELAKATPPKQGADVPQSEKPKPEAVKPGTDSAKAIADEKTASQAATKTETKSGPNEKLETLQKENAAAQQAAAESLKKLAQEMRQNAPETGKKPETGEKPGSEKNPSKSELALNDQPKATSEKPKGASPMPVGTTEDAQKPKSAGGKETNSTAAPSKLPDSNSANPEKPAGKEPVEKGPQAASDSAAEEAKQLAQAARDLQKRVEQAQQAQNSAPQKQQQEKLSDTLRGLNEQLQEAQERANRLSQEQPGSSESKVGQTKHGQSKPEQTKSQSAVSGPDSEAEAGKRAGAANVPGSKSDKTQAEQKASGTGSNKKPEAGGKLSSVPGTAQSQQQAVKQAQQAMEDALQQLQQGNIEQSAKSGQKAADALEQLAGTPSEDQSKSSAKLESKPESRAPNEGAGQPANEPQIPAAAANQVAKALEQLGNESPSKPTPETAMESKPGSSAAADKSKDPIPGQKSSSPMRSEELASKSAGQAESKDAPGQQSPMSSGKNQTDKNQTENSQPGEKSAAGQPMTGEGNQAPSGSPGSSRAEKKSAGKPVGSSAQKGANPGQKEAVYGPSGAGTGTASESGGAPGNSGTPKQPTSPLQSAAQRLQAASQALKQAAAQVQKPGKNASSQASNSTGSGQGGGPHDAAEPQSEEGSGTASQGQQPHANPAAEGQLENPDSQLQKLKRRMAGRKWGELPGTLQTEILQASQKKPNSEYGDLIRQYFKEIAKSQPVAPQK
ncbi:MAG: hypothetical protein JWM11_3384 [Planctomycetaceae bacterium]|nr:hypothetical protein [Planctomycetaceae bacterium]